MAVDCTYYERGVRQPIGPLSLEEAARLRRRGSDYVWIEAHEPSTETMEALSREFGLHELAVEDAGRAHQRPKVEGYDGFYFLVYRTVCLARGEIDFGELDVFVGPGFVIAVRNGAAGDPELARARLERHPELLKTGPAAVVWGILDAVVDDYKPVVEWLERSIDEVERDVFSRGEDLTERIYLLKRQIDELYRAVHPLLEPLEALQRGEFGQLDESIRRYFRDIADHVRTTQDEVLSQRDELLGALNANLSLIAVRQNEIAANQNRVIRQLTLVATVFLPLTFVTGFFGQNFGWLVKHVGSLPAFLLLGVGGLVVPLVVLLAWLRRSAR